MHTIQAVITGIIQGLSEFLPVSSSAHIVFSNELYHLISNTTGSINHQEEIFFDIVVHLGTLLAVLIYFFKDIKTILVNSFFSLKNKDYSNNEFKMLLFIILATFITSLMGLILKKPTEMLVLNPKFICFCLIITGVLLLYSEKLYKGDKKINLKSAIFIGIAQGLAIFPGFSRSGFTISSALLSGMDRIESARFSFLLSIPIILLASMGYPMFELDITQIKDFNIKALIVGFFVSFITGYFCIKYFMKLLKKLSLRIFGYYCLIVSIAMFLLFQFVYHQ